MGVGGGFKAADLSLRAMRANNSRENINVMQKSIQKSTQNHQVCISYIMNPVLRPLPSAGPLLKRYVNQSITTVPTPAVILDRAKMKKHCDSMFEVANALGVDFRAHIKTHKVRNFTHCRYLSRTNSAIKTAQGVHLQAGSQKNVRLIASTIAEIEHVLPVLQEMKQSSRHVNMLYGIPLLASQVDRLAAIACQLGPDSISALIDHPAQIDHVIKFWNTAGLPIGVYLKVDTGYHRAGLPASKLNKDDLLAKLLDLDDKGQINFLGLYSHSSLSYNGSTAAEAVAHLESEIQGCLDALQFHSSLFSPKKEIVISVGASPQCISAKALIGSGANVEQEATRLRHLISKVNTQSSGLRTKLELHAGVYAILDIQQLSTRSWNHGNYEDEIAISVMAEVCSVYNDGERQQPEVLVAVGVLGLGREPCFAYSGWGVAHSKAYATTAGKSQRRLIVNRVSQEHCILAWETGSEDGDDVNLPPIPLEVGQKIQIYPNHACITGAMYPYYFVVDSSMNEDTIQDVWVRASGW